MSIASHFGRTAALAALLASTAAFAQTAAPAPAADPLLESFRTPPDSARPRTWWHWLNGNITEDGIVKDLEWMKRVGLGGVQAFDASLLTPQVVDKRLAYMTPEWRHAFRLAASTADRLGLEFAIAGSPGWSETGGPWVPPADGMKKLVWSETDLVGGRRVTMKLAPPPNVTGPFRGLPFDDPLAAFEGKSGRTPPRFYADVAVLAYPITTGAIATPTINGGIAPVGDIALARGKPDAPAMLALEYAGPVTIRSANLFVRDALPPFGDADVLPVLEAQTATGWHRVAPLPLGTVPTTVSFAPVTARAFRIVFGPNTAPPTIGLGAPAPGVVMEGMFPGGGAAPPPIRIAHVGLSGAAKVDRFEAKAGFATVGDYYALSTTLPDESGIDPERVVDLTSKMRPDGTLDWTPPTGRWRVLRLGSSLLGTTNHPATPEATGLEVDKYDSAAVKRYLDTYLGNYRAATGAGLIGKAGVRALVTDSFEAGDANWTPRLAEQFRRLRGYDMTPWLPALTGAVVGSRAKSDAFLYDYRRTLADLLASEHYGTVATVAHANGLKLYGEALENGRPALGNDIALRAHTDVPMAAMWTFPSEGQPRPTLIGDVRGAASVAHVYGQNLVAAESFTSAFAPWAFAPADLKHVADFEFVNGINRPVIHTSVHQPTDDKLPGLSLAIFGQYFNRHDSWAEMARPWIDYLARTSFLLQQGRSVADVAYFFGEEAPLTQLYAQAPLADVPLTHGYDFVDADALIGQLSVEDGALVAKSGARYRVLYLGGTARRMTLPVLRRIAALAEAGATVIGDAPTGSPSLNDDRAAYATIVQRLWGRAPITQVGQGRIIAGHNVEAALQQINVAPDFAFTKPRPDSDVPFLHRRLEDGDLYFVVNRHARAESIEARFRVTDRVPELWHADSGQSVPASYRIERGQTIVPLALAAGDAVFVVFRKPTSALSATIAPVPRGVVRSIDGPWSIAFQPGRGAPATIRMATLAPLETQRDPGVRYFSGIATYTTTITVPGTPGSHQILDLGRVGDVAEVRVNGRLVGATWHAPYRVDIGGAVTSGANRIEVRVANLWVNRLVGDAQPGAAKHSWTALPTYRADAPLRPSGLIGPVTLSAQP
uniref:glycosyl hydrolase n=1 Tax=uncultured Sphingomonas sp. TaxID=158754 RepID=UPI0035CBEB07